MYLSFLKLVKYKIITNFTPNAKARKYAFFLNKNSGIISQCILYTTDYCGVSNTLEMSKVQELRL